MISLSSHTFWSWWIRVIILERLFAYEGNKITHHMKFRVNHAFWGTTFTGLITKDMWVGFGYFSMLAYCAYNYDWACDFTYGSGCKGWNSYFFDRLNMKEGVIGEHILCSRGLLQYCCHQTIISKLPCFIFLWNGCNMLHWSIIYCLRNFPITQEYATVWSSILEPVAESFSTWTLLPANGLCSYWMLTGWGLTHNWKLRTAAVGHWVLISHGYLGWHTCLHRSVSYTAVWMDLGWLLLWKTGFASCMGWTILGLHTAAISCFGCMATGCLLFWLYGYWLSAGSLLFWLYGYWLSVGWVLKWAGCCCGLTVWVEQGCLLLRKAYYDSGMGLYLLGAGCCCGTTIVWPKNVSVICLKDTWKPMHAAAVSWKTPKGAAWELLTYWYLRSEYNLPGWKLKTHWKAMSLTAAAWNRWSVQGQYWNHWSVLEMGCWLLVGAYQDSCLGLIPLWNKLTDLEDSATIRTKCYSQSLFLSFAGILPLFPTCTATGQLLNEAQKPPGSNCLLILLLSAFWKSACCYCCLLRIYNFSYFPIGSVCMGWGYKGWTPNVSNQSTHNTKSFHDRLVIRISIDDRNRRDVNLRIGCLVSYFWSPKIVSGADSGVCP